MRAYEYTRLSGVVGSVIDRSKKFNRIEITTRFSVENERDRQEGAAAPTSDSDSLVRVGCRCVYMFLLSSGLSSKFVSVYLHGRFEVSF